MSDQEYNLFMYQVKKLQKKKNKETSLEILVGADLLIHSRNFRIPFKSSSKIFLKIK